MSNVHSPEDKTGAEDESSQSLAEKVSFAIAALLLAGVVALIGYLWVSKGEQNPPNPVVTSLKPAQKLSGRFHVPFEVTNEGDDTAEAVQVMAELRLPDGTMEMGEQQIDFLSSHETESGAFIFSQDPRQGKLVVRVTSYKDP